MNLARIRRDKLDSEHSALCADLEKVVEGDVRFDAASRGLYTSDASNYRQVPVGVIMPRDADDVVRAVNVCRGHGVPVLGRGGGTSLAGQCVNAGVVFDFTRYMNKVVEINDSEKWARVQPGCILDHLRDEAGEHDLTFGPDPSTHNHCALGGMLGNNSCGVHAVLSEFYGPGPRTDSHVIELDVVTYQGHRMTVGATSDEEYARIQAEGGPKAEIYRQLRNLAERFSAAIRERYPDIPRRVSGYNLPDLLPDNGFHVGRALVGSESTLVLILEAKLILTKRYPKRSLLVVGYPNVFAAGDHIPFVRSHKPVGCEGFDRRLVDYNLMKGHQTKALQILPDGEGWLLVETGADTQEEADRRAADIKQALEKENTVVGVRHLTDPADQQLLWEMRKSGLGATAHVPGKPDTFEGWEDAAVPVDKVGAYLRDFEKLLSRFGFEASVYGHFGQGCIHVRIPFDFKSKEGIAQFRAFTDKAADLVVSYGGSLSGEHGDGQSRGELLVKMFGPSLIGAFGEMKDIWDPDGKMNPGKGPARPASRTAHLRVDPAYPAWQPQPVFAYPEDHGDFSHVAERCVGVGECRKEEGDVMCPSWRATHEEMHSTRGRAHLLFEMVKGDVIKGGWQSEEVKESLDLCLACKGCKNDCPVNVDMATYKAEFNYHYYKHKPRPRQAYAFGLIHRWAKLASKVPALVNGFGHAPGLERMAKAAAGMPRERAIPRFAAESFQSMQAGQRPRLTDGTGTDNLVILFPDTFNNYLHPGVLVAGKRVLEDAGFSVLVPPEALCCGRALYDYGMLDTARDLWRTMLDTLHEPIRKQVPLVGMEPSCVAAFRDELPNLFPRDEYARALSKHSFTLSEFLVERAPHYDVPRLDMLATVKPHCHHASIMGFSAEEQVMQRMGIESNVVTGCCGMAGSFGFEDEKYDVSMKVWEQGSAPSYDQAGDSLLMADGFSCKEQIRHATGRDAYHLAEVMAHAIDLREADAVASQREAAE